MKYGYLRCFYNEQKREQVDNILEVADVDELFIDEGNKSQFVKYKEMCEILGIDDEVYILDLDALGNTIQEIWARWNDLYEDKRVKIHVLNFLNEISEKSIGMLLNYFAVREKNKWCEKQRIGIDRAKSKGKIGRPALKRPSDFGNVYEDVQRGKLTVKQAIRHLGISQSTYYKFVSEYDEPELPFM